MTKRSWPILLALIAAVLVVRAGALPSANEAAGARLSIFDVGQGDAILVTTPHRQHILIDGGPDGTVLTRLGTAMRFHEHTIDLMIVSHNHADHITGLNRVLTRYDVKNVWLSGAIHTTNEYVELVKNLRDKHIPTRVVWAGADEALDGVRLHVVFPLASQEGARPDDQHDATVVVRACYVTCALLTGDLNEGHERAMVDSAAELAAAVLKVPHHGSATGLLPVFLARVNPQFAVISVGAGNSFGHPAPSILARLKEANVATFRTDQNGTVTCVLAHVASCQSR